MARNRKIVDAPVDVVFAVLSDPRTYGRFVVGSKRIRRFDPTWPEPGSVFHHTLGLGPLVLRDVTAVVDVEAPHRLVLRAQMRPFAVNAVVFSLRPRDHRTEVEVEEQAVEGPAAALWNPLLDRLMWLRNHLMLRRLKKLAERRLARRSEAAAP